MRVAQVRDLRWRTQRQAGHLRILRRLRLALGLRRGRGLRERRRPGIRGCVEDVVTVRRGAGGARPPRAARRRGQPHIATEPRATRNRHRSAIAQAQTPNAQADAGRVPLHTRAADGRRELAVEVRQGRGPTDRAASARPDHARVTEETVGGVRERSVVRGAPRLIRGGEQ